MLQRPWARVKDPTPIPTELDPDVLFDLGRDEFAELIRDNLLSRNKEGRAQWAQLWNLLANDPELKNRTLDTLDDFDDAMEDLRADPDAAESDLKRSIQFAVRVDGAANRLGIRAADAEPLAWLGSMRAKRYPLVARKKLDQVVKAIVKHRTAYQDKASGPVERGIADRELWSLPENIGNIRAKRYPPKTQRKLGQMVKAIAKHRTIFQDDESDPDERAVADQELWSVLEEIGLDPER